MDEKILNSFNPQQRDAIEYCDGPSLVVAGAGSGKTRVLTYKIAFLLEMGYEPWSILALTFTNKAAGEMKSRIADIVGMERARYLWMGTFHSVFLRILRTECERIGFSRNLTIYDASDSKSLLKSIIKEMGLDDKTYKASDIQCRISEAKNRLIDHEGYAHNGDLYMADMRDKVPAVRDIYERYQNRLRQSDAMDFDDILLFTYKLFKDNPDVLEKYEQRFCYVLVDEYQDTNYAQHQIVLQLTHTRERVCVVGDDAQSIYSFRGANLGNILNFQKLYSSEVKLFKLEQNYRSTQTIVNAANSLIHKNLEQIDKTVFSQKEVGERILITEAYSDIEESQIVVRKVKELNRTEGLRYSDFAVLYRTNAQSRLFEEELRKNSIPYRIYGGLSFYGRKEIKDVIAYFRLAVNPNDEEALKRVINYPARGIGNTTVAKIVAAANQNNVSLWEVLQNPSAKGVAVNGGIMQKLAEFTMLIQSFINIAQTQPADKAGDHIIRNCGILSDIYSDKSPENLSRQENVEELVNGLDDFVRGRQEEEIQGIMLTDYLAEVSLLSDVDSDEGEDDNKVTLMTIHAAKGLEFSTVFVVGLEEGLFPNQMSMGNRRELEEERRLLYVAITRAKQHVFITYAKSRLHFGKMEFSNPSRFLKDIDGQFVNYRMNGRGQAFGRDVDLPWQRRKPSFFGETPQRTVTTSYQPSVSHTSTFRRLEPSSTQATSRPTTTSGSSSASSSGLRAGQHIEHERFGQGVVLKVDGAGENQKAVVSFQNAGEKTLLLKFARFKVLD